MRFGIIDHNDDTGRPHVRQVAERLELIEAYDRLGFYAYHLTEHHGTPLAVTPSPHLMLAAAAQRTSRLRLGTLITILSLYHPMHGHLAALQRARPEARKRSCAPCPEMM
jgi:alkanesulfonate monooxygenase SsuD/methylene tetrahydromethanopterin reductase-like flavin-dependent oxidoreductase (luciferase family)